MPLDQNIYLGCGQKNVPLPKKLIAVKKALYIGKTLIFDDKANPMNMPANIESVFRLLIDILQMKNIPQIQKNVAKVSTAK